MLKRSGHSPLSKIFSRSLVHDEKFGPLLKMMPLTLVVRHPYSVRQAVVKSRPAWTIGFRARRPRAIVQVGYICRDSNVHRLGQLGPRWRHAWVH